MKKNLQEDQWAKELRDWENEPSSEAWDRPSAGMWEHIAKDLPSKESKKTGLWWRSALLILLAASVTLAAYFILPQKADETVERAEGVPVVEMQSLNSNVNRAVINNEIPLSTDSETIDAQTSETSITQVASPPISISNHSAINKEIPVSIDDKSTINEISETDVANVVNTPILLPDYSVINNEISLSADSEAIDDQTNETSIVQVENPTGSTSNHSAINKEIPVLIDDKSTVDKRSETDEANVVNTPILLTDHSVVNNEIPVLTDSEAIGDQTSETKIAQVASPAGSISNSYPSSINIPTLSFTVDALKPTLATAPVLTKSAHSRWSADLFVLGNLEEQQRFRSPLISSTKEQSIAYGVQLNRKLGKRFNVHVGAQKSTDIVIGTARFVRFFDRSRETTDGEKKISEFNLTTDFGDGDRVDDNLKIERDNTEEVDDQTRLLLEINRRFTLKTYSIPLQLSYSLWSQYPFRLSGLVGAKFSRTEQLIENAGVTVLNTQFRVRQFNEGRPVLIRTETSSSVDLQAGLRLDVHLSPKLSAMAQFDYQGQSSNQLSPFVDVGGSQVRLGLSYGF